MAKIIKYQLMTEVKNVYQIPITEEVEKTVQKESPIWPDGSILDVYMTETITETVVTGYEEKEEVTQIFSDVEIRCTEANFAANYAIAEKEAYNGIIEEYDDGQPEPEAPAADGDAATWTELAGALQEGVDNV